MERFDHTVGIIGGGASGIGVAKALTEAGLDYEVLEASSRLGGNWQPDGPASKMYGSVHLISSRRNTQFSDLPMPDGYPHYPRHSQMYAYLSSVAEHSNVAAHTRFNVRVVQALPDGGGWLCRLDDGTQRRYAHLVVANGLLRIPVLPAVEGHFDGESVHSAAYKSADLFRGKRVLVVGGGNSGCDIAVDAALNAAQAFHSTRRGYHYMPKFVDGKPTQEWLMDIAPKFTDPAAYWDHVSAVFKLAGFDGTDFGLPAPDHRIDEAHPIMNSQVLYHIGHGDLAPKPDIRRLDGRIVEFTDGSREEIDLILWATGFRTDLSFFDPAHFDARTELDRLFLRMVPQRHDNLLFVGYLNTPSGLGNLLNITARFVAACLRARIAGSDNWQHFLQIKQQPERLDLGQARFMATDRHRFEVDLWKYIRAVNFVTGKLLSGAAPATASVREEAVSA
jgi:hypothetical protein